MRISKEPTGPQLTEVTVPTNGTVGVPLTIRVKAKNNGATAVGNFAVSFVELTGSGDDSAVSKGPGTSSDVAFTPYAQGETIWTKDSGTMPASYLMVDATDTNWSSGKEDTFEVTFSPPRAGTYTVNVRASIGTVNAPSVSGATDQQGWPVDQHTI